MATARIRRGIANHLRRHRGTVPSSFALDATMILVLSVRLAINRPAYPIHEQSIDSWRPSCDEFY